MSRVALERLCRVAPAAAITISVIAGLGLAAPARGQDRDVQDGDDSPGPVDIASARAAHNRADDRVVFVIATHADFSATTLRASGGAPGSICINVWTTRRPREARPNYELCAVPDTAGNLKASIARLPRRGAARRLGAVDVSQASGRRVEIRLDPDRIRRPRAFRWTAEATTFGDGCTGATGCLDSAPDRPATAETRVGTARSSAH